MKKIIIILIVVLVLAFGDSVLAASCLSNTDCPFGSNCINGQCQAFSASATAARKGVFHYGCQFTDISTAQVGFGSTKASLKDLFALLYDQVNAKVEKGFSQATSVDAAFITATKSQLDAIDKKLTDIQAKLVAKGCF